MKTFSLIEGESKKKARAIYYIIHMILSAYYSPICAKNSKNSSEQDQHEAQYDDENCARSESTGNFLAAKFLPETESVITGDRLVDPHLVDSGLIPKKKEQEVFLSGNRAHKKFPQCV